MRRTTLADDIIERRVLVVRKDNKFQLPLPVERMARPNALTGSS